MSDTELVNLDVNQPLWEHFFTVAPIIIVGTKEENGNYDLATKSQCTPLGWSNYFAFVCTPRHTTYHNVRREKVFTVSFPNPEQIILTSLSASPRCEDHSKPALSVLQTFPATKIDGVLLKDAYLYLECELERIIDNFGENSLIIGKIVAAAVQNKALRLSGLDDQDLLMKAPLLAYLSPGRYAKIDHSNSFPFHSGFSQ
jgi:flavin reductase (DIM6/NTAB) family NADH-FMN oxidoreductase RutF